MNFLATGLVAILQPPETPSVLHRLWFKTVFLRASAKPQYKTKTQPPFMRGCALGARNSPGSLIGEVQLVEPDRVGRLPVVAILLVVDGHAVPRRGSGALVVVE